MKRHLLLAALLAFAASAAPAAADTPPPSVIGNDATDDCSSPGSVIFEGLTPETVGLVEPGGRVYTEDGDYPLPAGEWSAYIFIPNGELLAQHQWTIHACVPRSHPRAKRVPTGGGSQALPTLPPTDTAS